MIKPEKTSKEEQFIINQSPEISVGENLKGMQRLASAFPALKNRNYRLYFSGQLISLVGTWLQIVAQGWLVLQLTNSALVLGTVAALATAPTLFLSLFGGVIVDRYPKKNIILFSQGSAMVLALLLGTLALLNIVTVEMIGLIAFLLGVVTAVDSPARQAFVPEIVTKEQLPSAIALNSGSFNAARVIGPSVAGLLIAGVGTGGAFILNGLSYMAVISALLVMQVDVEIREMKIKPLVAIKEGISYSFNHPIIRVLIIITGVVSVFGWSYSTLLPIIALNDFQLDAKGLGYMYAASGLGSLIATFMVGAYANKVSPVLFIFGGICLFSLSLVMFSYTKLLYMALPLLFLIGFGLLCLSAMMNTIIQSLVKSELRGRVMSIYILMFIGMSPVGNFLVGWLAEHWGSGFAIRVGGLVVLLFGTLVFLHRNKIRKAYFSYKKVNQM
jgi:MFS family permease